MFDDHREDDFWDRQDQDRERYASAQVEADQMAEAAHYEMLAEEDEEEFARQQAEEILALEAYQTDQRAYHGYCWGAEVDLQPMIDYELELHREAR